MDPKGRLGEIVENEVESLGYELVKFDSYSSGRRKVLRIFIDDPLGSVTLDDCIKVTKSIGFALEGEDLIPGPYNLEVSSPGINRPLVKIEHFARFTGKNAKVEFMTPEGGKGSFIGKIVEASSGGIVFDVMGTPRNLSLDSILKANLHGEKWKIEKKRKPSGG